MCLAMKDMSANELLLVFNGNSDHSPLLVLSYCYSIAKQICLTHGLDSFKMS